MPSNEQILRNYKSSNTACVFLLPDSPKFTIIDANDSYLSLSGKTLNQIKDKSLFDAFPEDNDDVNKKRVKAVRGSLKNVLRLKKTNKLRLQRYDLEIDNHGFVPKFWNSDTIPILDDDSNVLFLVHTIVDITEFVMQQAKQSGDEVMLHENLAHPLFNDYPDGVATLDLYGNFLSVNRIFVDQAESKKEDLLLMSFLPFIAEKDFTRVFDFFQKAMKGEIQNFEAEMVNGKARQLMLNMTFLPVIANNEVLGVYLITKDLTSLKLAEQQAEANQTQLIAILESITDGFFAVDTNWIVTYFNKEAEKISGITRMEIIGKNLWDNFPDVLPSKFFKEYQRAMDDKVSVRFEEFVLSANLWLEVAVYPNDNGLSVYFRDVTERVNAAMELRKAKERYLSLFDFSPFPIWVYDTESLMILAVNSAAIDTYGYSEEEFLMLTIRDIRIADEQAKLDAMIAEKVKTQKADKDTVFMIKKSGEVLTAEIDSHPLPSWSENARIVVAQDVTDKIKAEEALKGSEQRFKALVQDGSDLTAILDISGNFKYLSPSTKRILGVDPELLVNKNIFEFVHPEDKAKVIEDFSHLGNVKSKQMAPFRIIAGPNQHRWIETVITDLSDESAVDGIIVNARDVTQRINTEIKIKTSINHYNRISKANSDAIYDWDLRTNELKWSQGFHEVFGYSEKNGEKKNSWLELIHPEDRERVIDQVYLNLKDKKTRWKEQYRFLTSGGLYKAVLDRGFFIFDADGKPERMIGAMQDVTERMTYLSNMEQQNKLLKEISWLQSHIVRAPLARIMGLSELLTYNEGQITNTELLAHLTDSAQELDKIISSILTQTDKG